MGKHNEAWNIWMNEMLDALQAFAERNDVDILIDGGDIIAY